MLLTIEELVRRAKICFNNQMRRCYTPTNPRFKDNGAKGIRVEYDQKRFIEWFVSNHPNTNEKWSVGRIDHAKNYMFDNIKFETLAENSLERIARVGTTRPRQKIIIVDADSGEHIFIGDSLAMASKMTGVFSGHIPKYCRKELKRSKRGYTFVYAE